MRLITNAIKYPSRNCVEPLDDHEVRKHKLKWFEHMKRSSRPQRRRRDDIKEWKKSGWNELNAKVKDHVEWTNMHVQ